MSNHDRHVLGARVSPALAWWMLVSSGAMAFGPDPSPCAPCIEALEAPHKQPGIAATLGWMLGGAAAGFVTHEMGHVVANWAYDNSPAFKSLTAFGFVPFFAISPDIDCEGAGCTTRTGAPFAGGRRGKYLISVAGFLVGDISSEIILGTEPCLRYKNAPFRTGWLVFNTLLALGYAASTVSGVEVSNGDAGGAASAAQLDRGWLAAMLVMPALLDTYRYVWPGSDWAPWVSRGAKATMVGVAFTF